MSELTPMNYGRIVRPSIAHTIDKVNEVIDWINNSEIKSTKLVETGEGAEIQVGNATQLASLGMEGLAIQDGTPTPDNPVEVRVCRGRNLAHDADKISPWSTSQSMSQLAIYDATVDGALAFETYTISVVANPVKFSASASIIIVNRQSGASYISASQLGLAANTANVGVFSTTITNTEGDPITSIKLPYYTDSWAKYDASSIMSVQLELGPTPTPYVPYGHVGLEVRDSSDELVSVTPIPLPSKGFAASLPDGTADVLAIDSAGGYEWGAPVDVVDLGTLTWNYVSGGPYFYAIVSGKKTGVFNILSEPFATASRAGAANLQNGEIVGANGDTAVYVKNTSYSDAASFKASLSGEMLYYQLATPTTEHAYIDLPIIPEGAVIDIPELREVGVKCFVPGVSELIDHANNWGARCKENESRIAALEAAIANLATSEEGTNND